MNAFENLTSFKNKDDVTHYFVKTLKNNRVLVWKEVKDGEHLCGELDYETVNEEILTEAGLWDEIPVKVQTKIKKVQDKKKNEIAERMAIARKKRKKKYSDLPQELVCKCGKKIKANWSYLQKKADKMGIPAIELAEKYICQSCCPSRGRRKKNN